MKYLLKLEMLCNRFAFFLQENCVVLSKNSHFFFFFFMIKLLRLVIVLYKFMTPEILFSIYILLLMYQLYSRYILQTIKSFYFFNINLFILIGG